MISGPRSAATRRADALPARRGAAATPAAAGEDTAKTNLRALAADGFAPAAAALLRLTLE